MVNTNYEKPLKVNFIFSNFKFFTPVLLFLFIYLSTSIVNDGFMASDEYWTGITRYIPAQSAQLSTLVLSDDVKSPVQLLPFYLTSQLAFKIGIEHPYQQYRFTCIVLAIINSLILLLSFLLYYKFAIIHNFKTFSFFILFVTFFYPMAFTLTRPMFETQSAPWLFLAIVLAYIYDLKKINNFNHLFLSGLALTISFLLRPQVGLVGLVLIILPILHKNKKDFINITLTGIILFLAAGIPDLYLRGKFHYSLLAVTKYNFESGHLYGKDPWYYYLLFIPILTLMPFWIFKITKSDFMSVLKSHRTFFLSIALFVLLHSLFSQKFERFIIPIIPALVILMFQFVIGSRLINDPISQNKFNLKNKILFTIGIILNFVLFICASFFPSQKNIIDFSKFVDNNKNLSQYYNLNESITWYPDAFVFQKNRTVGLPGEVKINIPLNNEQNNSELEKLKNLKISCNEIIVANEKEKTRFENILNDKFKLVSILEVNPLEHLAYLLNPEHNVRRSSLYIFTEPSCN